MCVIHPAATNHTSYMIRSAALTLLGELPEAVGLLLPAGTRSSLLELLAAAAATDSAAAVRSSAYKTLGMLCLATSWLLQPALAHRVLSTLAVAVKDSVLSVRIAASWALANLCQGQAALWNQQQQQLQQGQGAQPEPGLDQWQRLGGLCKAAAQLLRDTDKVRANGVTATGHLLSFVQAWPELEQQLDFGAWLDSAMGCLQSCLTTGNMKVQWSACCALLSLLHNPSGLMWPERVQARLPS